MPYNLSIMGWFSENQLKTIEQIARTVPENGVVVEIGSMYGRSTVCWAKSCPKTATIYAIDYFAETKVDNHPFSDDVVLMNNFPKSGIVYPQNKIFDENINGLENIKKIKGYSPYNIDYSGNDIDVLFLDAAHHNPNDWDNIVFFSKFMKVGGSICGHDYSNDFPDILENVKRLEEYFNVTAIIREQIWNIKVTKKLDL